MTRSFLPKRLLQPVVRLLRQGVTPEKIALSIALGVTLGVFPLIGSTTLLCAGAAFAFRLNLAAIQLVNYLVYPLQLALLIPFLRAGSSLAGTPAAFSLSQILELSRSDVPRAVSTLCAATLGAVALWALLCPVVAAAIYFTLAPALRRLAAAMNRSGPPDVPSPFRP